MKDYLSITILLKAEEDEGLRLRVEEYQKNKKAHEIKVDYIEGDAYYPDGKGGQLGDRGSIGDAQVVEVKKASIVVDREIAPGEYEYTIQRDRQVDIAIQHTGEHLFSGIAFRDYGFKNVGFRMAEEYTTVDLDSADISLDMIEAMEKEINRSIREGIKVDDFTISREEAEKREELRKEISHKIVGDIRFIEIPGVDLCACGGFHVKNTREIQLFKFINWEKVKGNYTRFYFLCGERAIEDYRKKNTIIKEANKLFSSKDHEILGFIENTLRDKKEAESKLKNLSIQYAELLSKNLMKEAREVEGKKVVFYPENDSVANSLSRFINDEEYTLIFGGEGQYTVISKSIDCKDFIGTLRDKFSVKGGGNQIRGSFKGDLGFKEILTALEDFLK